MRPKTAVVTGLITRINYEQGCKTMNFTAMFNLSLPGATAEANIPCCHSRASGYAGCTKPGTGRSVVRDGT